MNKKAGFGLLFLIFIILGGIGWYFYNDYQIQKQHEEVLAKIEQNPKTAQFTYFLDGKKYQLQTTMYKGLNDYLKQQPRFITYKKDEPIPDERDFINKNINNPYQRPYLKSIAQTINNLEYNNNDKARIAISLVQNIPYDTIAFESGKLTGKYPYEVLYTGKGVCGEKSELLIYLLKELNFGVAYFSFDDENHASVGIKCDKQHSYKNSGYCFVETTKPSLITDSDNEYANVGKLESIPKVIVLNEGFTFNAQEEYDANLQYELLIDLEKPTKEQYQQRISILQKYGLSETECKDDFELCNGECFKPCEFPYVFSCTDQGVICDFDGINCPQGTNLCNGECFKECDQGYFECKEGVGYCMV